MTNLEHKLILCDISILTFDKNFQPLITTLTVNIPFRMMVILYKNLSEVTTTCFNIFNLILIKDNSNFKNNKNLKEMLS